MYEILITVLITNELIMSLTIVPNINHNSVNNKRTYKILIYSLNVEKNVKLKGIWSADQNINQQKFAIKVSKSLCTIKNQYVCLSQNLTAG